MKLLINTPDYRKPYTGGVANHYHGLIGYWKAKVKYNIIGSRGKKGSGKYWLLYDIPKFILKILIFNPNIILLNPSLGENAIKRDRLFFNIAKLLNKKVAVFIHGFDKNYIEKTNIKNFVNTFNKSECIIVLANEFLITLREWGITAPIQLTTTKVNDKLVETFDIHTRNGKIENILFLARITKEKGIFIALEAFNLIQKKYPNIKLRIVGDGNALEQAKELCHNKEITNVTFCGALSGTELINEYKNADLYLFPTYHAEGMPTSVLEAMAFGLPIITRGVGGVKDFFKQEQMGLLIESLEPMDFAQAIEKYINNEEVVKNICFTNYNYANKHFLASTVASNIENILKLYI